MRILVCAFAAIALALSAFSSYAHAAPPAINAGVNVPAGGQIKDPNAPATPTFVIQDGTGKFTYPIDPPVGFPSSTQILTTTALGSSAVYTSAWQDASAIGQRSLAITGFADQAGSFIIQQTNDSANPNLIRNAPCGSGPIGMTCASNGIYTTLASTEFITSNVYIPERYWRVVYTNGASAQTSFELTVTAAQNPKFLTVSTPAPDPTAPNGYIGTWNSNSLCDVNANCAAVTSGALNVTGNFTLNFGGSIGNFSLAQIGGNPVGSDLYEAPPGQFGNTLPANLLNTLGIMACVNASPAPAPSPGNVSFVPCNSQGYPSVVIANPTGSPIPVTCISGCPSPNPTYAPSSPAPSRICDGSGGLGFCAKVGSNNALRIAQDGVSTIATAGPITTAATTQVLAPNGTKTPFIYWMGVQATGSESSATFQFEYSPNPGCTSSNSLLWFTTTAAPATSGQFTSTFGSGSMASAAFGSVGVPLTAVPAGDYICVVTAGTTINLGAIILVTWRE